MGLTMPGKYLETEKDAELRELAKMELDELEPKRQLVEGEIGELSCPAIPTTIGTVSLKYGRHRWR